MNESKLAKILYRIAKMAVAVLEKEYGFNRERVEYVEEIIVIKNNS